jgi:hypothetical protein
MIDRQARLDMEHFCRFVQESVGEGNLATPEELLERWRELNPREDDFEESVADLQKILAEIDAGMPGTPVNEFDSNFRERHCLPPNP